MPSLLNHLKKLDLFGKRVYLTHDGKEKFKTNFGGFMSLAYFITLLTVGLISTANVWTDRI